jgi:hypothetical protein
MTLVRRPAPLSLSSLPETVMRVVEFYAGHFGGGKCGEAEAGRQEGGHVSRQAGLKGMQATGHTCWHLRLVEMADAFGALVGIDLVNLRAHRDRVVRALGLAHVAIDAVVGNQ